MKPLANSLGPPFWSAFYGNLHYLNRIVSLTVPTRETRQLGNPCWRSRLTNTGGQTLTGIGGELKNLGVRKGSQGVEDCDTCDSRCSSSVAAHELGCPHVWTLPTLAAQGSA